MAVITDIPPAVEGRIREATQELLENYGNFTPDAVVQIVLDELTQIAFNTGKHGKRDRHNIKVA